MYIESLELKNYRNYQNLQLDFDKGTNIFTEIMHRERQISWSQCIFVGQRNRTEEARTKRSSVSGKRNLTFG